ncbi:MAG: metallophosphoesterase [Firmicutes bacterium]|nr:metallophosphoesterase [Bacillota bacterium]
MAKLTPIIKIALVGILGALLLVSVLSRQDATVYAFDFVLSIQIFDKGYTVVDLPPLGTVRAQTHQLPLMFRLSLSNINMQRLEEMVAGQHPEILFDQVQETLRTQVMQFLLRVLAIAFIGGFGAGYVYSRNLKKSAQAGLIGLLLFTVLIGSALYTYDENAFIAPEFEGVIEAAPWLLGVAEEALAAVEDIDVTMQVITSNLYMLFESLNFLRPLGTIDGDLKILHVSDIHNNLISVALIEQMLVSFDVDLIIDTGDITDYGTPLEAELLRAINNVGIPYVFVPGNHDSPAVISSFGRLENVYVLNEDLLYLEELDLLIAGIADPSAADTAMAVRPHEEYLHAAERLRELVEEAERPPDIIAAHHAWIVNEFTDLPSLLLHGHSHRSDIEVAGETFLIDAGSTGGAGIRGLMTREEMPYSMVLLHMNRYNERWRPVAGDIVRVNNLNAGFTLERHLLRPILPEILQEEQEETPEQPDVELGDEEE